MAESLYPVSVVTSDQPDSLVDQSGGSSYVAAADSSTATWLNGSGQAGIVYHLAPTSTVAAGQLGTVTVAFDARPQATLGYLPDALIAQLVDSSNGTIYAQSSYSYTGTTSFQPATVQFGALLSPAAINRLALVFFMPGGQFIERWEANDIRAVISSVFDGATTVAIAPTGAVTSNTPTFVWSTAVHDAGTEFDAYVRIRVFTPAQYSIGGFDPALSPATWDSGLRVGAPLKEIIGAPLPSGTYRAYIQSNQLVFPGAPWQGRSDQPVISGGALQAGPYAGPLSFSVIPAAPAIVGPKIKIDAVRDFSTAERKLLTEPILRIAPRVTLFSPGGIEARDLDITTGSVVLDSGARQRGTVSFTCTDLDIVPPKREQASGESRPLHPFGSYLHVCYSMQTSRYNTRVVGVGVFRITSVRPNAKAGTVEVKAKDFALNLAESRFGYPITRQTWVAGAPIPATVLAAAQAIISEAGLAYRTPSSAATTVAVNYTNKKGDDRGAALDGLSTALGWVWYFDIDGVCYFGPPASLITDPIAYTFYRADPDRGQLSAQIIDQDQELIRDDTYDVVIASDQAGLYIGGAYDATPNSIIARSAANPAGPHPAGRRGATRRTDQRHGNHHSGPAA
jgi:hypothetical protein